MDHCLLRVHFDLIQTKIDTILAILSVGIEPTTLGLLDPRSNQLSYEGIPLILQTPYTCAFSWSLAMDGKHCTATTSRCLQSRQGAGRRRACAAVGLRPGYTP